MKVVIKISALAMMLFSAHVLYAEYLYLNDGQVVQGKILSEDSESYIVETKYQRRKIKRSDVTRIMYGERKLERIYLLMRDGTKLDGYKVDEDAEKVIIREQENSPSEKTISKKDIKQMSGSEIIPLDPSVIIKCGLFYPIDSRGAKLKPAPAFYVGSGINFQFLKNMRINFEAGYVKNKSDNDKMYMRFIPMIVKADYNMGNGRLDIMPGIMFGGVILDYYDGETDVEREFAFIVGAGCNIDYEIIERTMFLRVFADYQMIADKKGRLNCLLGGGGVEMRF